jgi:hypothetical protein
VFTAHDVMTFCYQKLTCFHGGEEHGGALRDYTARLAEVRAVPALPLPSGRNSAIRRRLERDVHRVTAVSNELALAMRANGLRVDRVVHNAEARVAPFVARPERRRGLPQEAPPRAGMQLLAIAGRLHEQKGVAAALPRAGAPRRRVFRSACA